MRENRLEELERAMGYRFRQPELLERALTHRSAAPEGDVPLVGLDEVVELDQIDLVDTHSLE